MDASFVTSERRAAITTPRPSPTVECCCGSARKRGAGNDATCIANAPMSIELVRREACKVGALATRRNTTQPEYPALPSRGARNMDDPEAYGLANVATREHAQHEAWRPSRRGRSSPVVKACSGDNVVRRGKSFSKNITRRSESCACGAGDRAMVLRN